MDSQWTKCGKPEYPGAHFGFGCGLCCGSQESLSLLPKQEGNEQSGLRTDILFFLTQFSAASFRVALFLVFLSLLHSSYLVAPNSGGVLLISNLFYNKRCFFHCLFLGMMSSRDCSHSQRRLNANTAIWCKRQQQSPQFLHWRRKSCVDFHASNKSVDSLTFYSVILAA